MLNHQPIFVSTFARGGSNIVWEILQSHPDVCAPVEETDKIIWQQAGKWKKIVNVWLTLRGGQILPHPKMKKGFWMSNYGVFHANNYQERQLNKFTSRYLDNLLFNWKLKNLEHPFNKFKTPNQVYTKEELAKTRVVAKHVNGLIFLIPALIDVYPDSVHFGLVRNGLALCESRLRRKTFNSAAKFGVIYDEVVMKLLEYEERYSNFHLLRFEDLLSDPKQFIHNLYDKAGLSYDGNMKLRLKAKKYMDASGLHKTALQEGDKYWIDINDFFQFVNPNINENQIKKLKLEDRSDFLKNARNSMQKLGYI